jgi:ABC-type nitrate/sulfonate/bicarbonate transport system substrate-binding protein
MVRDCKETEKATILYSDNASARTRGLLACEGGGQHRYRNGWVNFSFLPFQIALEKRFYEKYDLSVKPVLMRAHAAIPALVSGDVDYDTHFGSLVRGAVTGLPMRVIFSTAEKQMFSLVVQPEIKTVENLKGKIVAISSFGGT